MNCLKLCDSKCYDEGGDSEKPFHCEDHYLTYPHHKDGTNCIHVLPNQGGLSDYKRNHNT